ncbi:MAG TPA: nuclear transport factor 2 family protein [Caulobacteraceae bacterium]|nr:nuclear transport factor 2 family protein [Caulobacteraceae bacterium]
MALTFFRLAMAATAAFAAPASAGARSEAAHAAAERLITHGEQAWGQAYVRGDVATIQRLLDARFRGIDPRGAVYDKASVIREVQKIPHETSDEVGPVTVRFFGGAAIAQAREYEVGPPPQRKRANRAFTDTWVRINGRWRIVAAEDVDPGPGGASTP